MNLVKIDSFTFDTVKRRVLKFLRKSRNAETATDASPFGYDGAPIKDMRAIYMASGEKGKDVIVGYLNTNLKAAAGEVRLFSLDANGEQSTLIWLHNNGIIDLGGTADNAVRYAKLNDAVTQHNAQVVAELGKISTAIANLGGAYTPGAVTFNIAQAKITEIKTP